MKKKLLSIVLTICMIASTLTVTSVTAVAAETSDTDVNYLYPVYNVTTGTDFEQASSGIKEWKKGTLTSSEYTVYNGQTTLNSGWYVVNGTFNLSSTITVSGDVHLVLCDGSSLKVETSGEPYGPGIAVTSGNSLSVYAQSTDDDTMGKLTALGNGNSAGIGGYFYEEGEANSGKITINGGNVTAENAGYGYGAGIGGGLGGSGKNITINGGNITAYGSWRAPAIGGGGDMYYENVQGSAQYITINGGVIYARGNDQDEIAIGAGANDSFEYGSAKDIKIADCLEVTADDKVLTHADDMAQSLSGKYAIDIAPYICYIDANNNGIFDTGDTKFSRLAQATTFASSTPSTLRLITNVVQRLIISDNEDITLDLDGYALLTEGNYWDYFVIDNVGKLKIIDSNTAGQTHYFTVNASGLWVLSDDITAEAKAAAVAYEDLTDTPKEGDVIAVYGGCVTGGRGMYVEGEYHGGGIYNKGSLVILDGSIIGNTAEYGAGVYNREDASLTIGGEAVIDYNIASVLGDNVMTFSPFDLATGDDAPTSGMKVGVTLVDDNKSVAGKFTTSAAKTDAQYFFSDNDAYTVLYNAGKYLELGVIPETPIYKVGEKDYFTAADLNKDIADGTVEEGSTIVLTGEKPDGTVVIDGKDMTIDGSALDAIVLPDNGVLASVTDKARVNVLGTMPATAKDNTADAPIYSEGFIYLGASSSSKALTTTGSVYQAKTVAEFMTAAATLTEVISLAVSAEVAPKTGDVIAIASKEGTAGATTFNQATGYYEATINGIYLSHVGNDLGLSVNANDVAVETLEDYTTVNYLSDAATAEGENAPTAATKTLIANLIIACKYINDVGTGNKGADIDLTDSELSWIDDAKTTTAPATKSMSIDASKECIRFASAGIHVTEKLNLFVEIEPKGEDINVVAPGTYVKAFIYNGSEYEPLAVVDDMVITGKNAQWYAYIDKLLPTQYDSDIKIELYTNTNTLAQTLHYSVNTYCSRMSTAQSNLCTALYNYGTAAKAVAELQ